VHAEWEGLGTLIFGILVVLLLGFGIFRSIRRRRREVPVEPVADNAEPVADNAEPVADNAESDKNG
jgi:hypothetical protein